MLDLSRMAEHNARPGQVPGLLRHGVAVLLRVYAGCIDGHEQLWNGRIDRPGCDGDPVVFRWQVGRS